VARAHAGEPSEALALAETRAWVERAVIGLRLCPFAAGAHRAGKVRYACSSARDADALLDDLRSEVERLLAASPEAIETTLLVHAWVLRDFESYNAFLDVADALLDALGASGVLQIASFHPDYRFAGTRADDVANATNRSPHPLLQLLREASVSAAVDAGADGEAIAEANVATLRRLGAAGWERLQADCGAEARAAISATPPVRPHRLPRQTR
jgi:hypothetical protein